MSPFRHERANDALGVIALLSSASTGAFIAAGTNLIDHVKLAERQPDLLVDSARLPYQQVEPLQDGGVRIGAQVRNADLAADRTIRARYPVLTQALLEDASGQPHRIDGSWSWRKA